MVTNGNRRADERVRIETLGIGQRNQHLAKYLSISLSQNADTPNPSWIAATFNRAGFHERQPIRDGVEAPNGCPHLLGGRSYHAAHKTCGILAIVQPPCAMRSRVSPGACSW